MAKHLIVLAFALIVAIALIPPALSQNEDDEEDEGWADYYDSDAEVDANDDDESPRGAFDFAKKVAVVAAKEAQAFWTFAKNEAHKIHDHLG